MEVEIGMIVETITGIEIETSLALEMKEMEEENIKDLEQVKETLTILNSVITVT